VSAAEGLLESVTRAQVSVRSALVSWDAGSLQQCEETCVLLRTALADLEAARRVAEEHHLRNCGSGQRQLAGMRADVGVLTRLVDASTAFGRGLALRVTTGGLTEEELREPSCSPTEVQA
jgi:hypothetical protein